MATNSLVDKSGKVRISTIIRFYVQMLNEYRISVGSPAHERLKILQDKVNRGETHLKPGKMTKIEKERAKIYRESKESK